MRQTGYGKTGKKVSVVGFGGMRFDESRPDEANAELVRYACAAGINYFDTAPGHGKSENPPPPGPSRPPTRNQISYQ